jgi:hypothetical protein
VMSGRHGGSRDAERLHPDGTILAMTHQYDPDDHPIIRDLQPDESIHSLVATGTSRVLVTDRRIAVAQADRTVLDVELARLRRIQFDIERERPATLVIVPEHVRDEPQVLAIPPHAYQAVGDALAFVGRRLYGMPSD